MKFCPNCGKEVPEDASFCPACGGRLSPQTQQSQQNVYGSAPNYGAPSFDSYSPLCIAGFVLAFLMPLVGLILSIVAHNDSKVTGSAKTRTLSKAGIIVSAVELALSVFVVIIAVVLVCGIIGAGLNYPVVYY